MTPWLSIIMPTYNGAAFLRGALESIAAQHDDEVEVIAVDDGSTDATLDILRHFAQRMPITILQRPHSGNWVESTNIGMQTARAAHLSFLHQDDAWCAARLKRIRALLGRWPDAVVFLHPCWYMDASGRRIGYWHCPLPRRGRPLSAAEVLERLLIQCFIAAPAPVFRTDAASSVGWLDSQLWYSADWDFWLKLARLGATVYHPVALASFRLHAASQTLKLAGRGGELRRQQAVVLGRHLGAWESLRPRDREVARVAHFSADVNAALADWAGGARPCRTQLIGRFVRLGPHAWRRYLRDSGIAERC
ncbi:MAG: glycosyltransferase family 2 protein, partial [Pirellulales bacterium]